MSFGDMLIKYPYLDITWELFKGVAPTFVALIAIFVNNRGAEKRDRRNKQRTYLLGQCMEFTEKIKDLKVLFWELTDFMDPLFPTNAGNAEDYEKNLYLMQLAKNRCLMNFYNISTHYIILNKTFGINLMIDKYIAGLEDSVLKISDIINRPSISEHKIESNTVEGAYQEYCTAVNKHIREFNVNVDSLTTDIAEVMKKNIY